jgi:two-component system chemotaxis response regulator CheB
MVVIGASAGGIEALQKLCSSLPVGLNAAIMVVMHTNPHSDGLLPQVLSRAGPLTASHPRDGEAIRKGSI